MTFLQAETPLRLKVDGFRKPLRLRSLGRAGALETFAVEGEPLQAVRFFPAGAVQEADGRLVAIPEAAQAYETALDAFEALGRRLQAAAPQAALPVKAVVRGPLGAVWLQKPAGLTLEAWLAAHSGPVAEPVVAAFARRLAKALTEIHAAGLTHRALSPRTVLIDGGEVRLTGFMIDRRPFFRPLRGQQDLVEVGYAPPEAHDGALRQPIDPSADLYAASALLQRLLTGHAPPAATARVAGDAAWRGDPAVSFALGAGIDAGLAPSAAARPADAEAWLTGLNLASEPGVATWFEDLQTPLSAAASPRPEPEPELEPDPLDVPLLPFADPHGVDAALTRDAPLTLARDRPARHRLGLWITAALTALAAALALVAPRLGQRPQTPIHTAAPKASPPSAPAGCQWLWGAGDWRLRCADAPAKGLSLPERFDAQTTARAAAGEPAAMERLGAFYRLRADEAANPNRAAYAYQALDWLQRAGDVTEDGRPDTARARDDSALALGQMLARGEGGRAPDPAAAEARLRQAAAGSRADAVLALGQFLEAQARGRTEQLAEVRSLYARVAQLGDGSPLQRQAEHGLTRIDAAARPQPAQIAPPPPARPPTPKPVKGPARTPAGTPKPVLKTKPPLKAVAERPRAKAAAPRVRPPKPANPSAPMILRSHPPLPRPALRNWTASTFIKVDPATDFSGALAAAGRSVCESEGGEILSVRAGDTNCPNGVDYCQVRAVATCQGARP